MKTNLVKIWFGFFLKNCLNWNEMEVVIYEGSEPQDQSQKSEPDHNVSALGKCNYYFD